jgi:DNA-binding NarL/FixJ family response regulator
MESQIKVAVVDDHEFFKSGVLLALKRIKFVSLVYSASDGIDFISKQRTNPADVVLLDINMPRLDGYSAFMQVRKEFPDLKVIILSVTEDESQIDKFVAAGVNGYLLKNIDQHDLETAIQAITRGEPYYSREVMSYLMRQLKIGREMDGARNKLSKRELEIFQLIYDGYSNQEIAEKLFISVRTVTNHRHNLKNKTATKNTAGLISFGLKNRLIH